MKFWRDAYRILAGCVVLSMLMASGSAAVFAAEGDPAGYATPVADVVEETPETAATPDTGTPEETQSQQSVLSRQSSVAKQRTELVYYTSDQDIIPKRTEFRITDEFGVGISFSSSEIPAANGFTHVIALSPGSYVVSVTPGFNEFGRQVQPFSQTIEVTGDTLRFAFTLPVQTTSTTLLITISMMDQGVIPEGVTWALYGSESSTPLVAGVVPAGGTLFTPLATTVATGSYRVIVKGNGYQYVQFITVESAPITVVMKLPRQTGTLDVNLTTSDGGNVPAGTIFQLTSGSTVVASHTTPTALANGSVLDLGSIEFGTYDLSIAPPADAAGRRVVPMTIPVSMTDPWTPNLTIDADLEIFVPSADVSLSVEMNDGGPIPMGLSWTLFPAGSWEAIATGPVTAGGTLFEHTLATQVPLGVYQLWITGNGYSSGQVIVIESDTFNHGFHLDRLMGTLAITVTTDDGAEIPAGTAWEIVDAGGTVVQSGILDAPLASGAMLPGVDPIEFGVYTLNIGPNAGSLSRMSLADLPRELLPFSAPLQIINPWFTEYPVTAHLLWADSDLSFGVTMSDNGPLPNGLTWMLVISGSWDPLASGPVTAGDVSFDGLVADPVPYGVYQLWITGNGYSSGQVMNIESLTSHHDFVLDRLIADVSVTLDTSDDGDVPAGTTWSLTNSAGDVIESGTLAAAVADGGSLPLSSPLEFDVYTLTINADGYHPITMELPLTNPWVSEYAFTASLVSDVLPTPSPSPTPATPVPTNPAPPAPSTPTPEATVTPVTVTTLPQTGSGDGSPLPVMLLAGVAIGLIGTFVAVDQRKRIQR